MCSDWDLFFRISSSYDVSYVNEPLNYFRQHSSTIRSSTKEKIVYEEYLRLLLGNIHLIKLFVFRTNTISFPFCICGRCIYFQIPLQDGIASPSLSNSIVQ